MERRAQALSLPVTRAFSARVEPGAVGAWTLGFAVIAYLGLKGGGYDVVIRSQVGIAIWWIVGLAAVCGLAGTRRLGWPLVSALGLFGAFTVWTLLSATWSLSPEGAVSEAARDVTLLGVFVLAATAVRRRNTALIVHGVLAAIVLVCSLAVLSRLQPTGVSETGQFLVGSESRLSYGLNYWNALGAFAAMGLPLALAVSIRAGSLAGQAVSAASIPVLSLTLFLTLSRGATIAAAAGLVVCLALSGHRLRWLATATLSGLGSLIVVEAAVQRDDVRQGLLTALAHNQGSELIVIVLVVTVGVALVRAGASLVPRAWIVPPVFAGRSPTPKAQAMIAVGIIAVAVGGFLAVGGPARVSDAWAQFKDPGITRQDNDLARLGSASGRGRYQYWVSAVDAWQGQPLRGIGAGGFENWWNQRATVPGHIRNAHSLYVETLAELGIVGALLLGAFILLVMTTGVARSLAGPRRERSLAAGATAAMAVFFVSAIADWTWQVAVLPAAVILLGVVVLRSSRGSSRLPRSWSVGTRIGLVILSVLGIASLIPAMTAATELRASQSAASSNQFAGALGHARRADDVQPYAVSPPLQRALVLETQGAFAAAAVQARLAAQREPTDWQPQFVLARIEGERGHGKEAVVAYRRAQALSKTTSFLHPGGFEK